MRFLSVLKMSLMLGCAVVVPNSSYAKDANTAAKSVVQSEARAPVFDAKSVTLENGMQVVVIENSIAPVVTHMVWYKVGAADEPRGKSGIAHFLEHLLFKGSEVVGRSPLAPGEFSQTVRRMGGNDNAFTSQDYTAYFQSVPVEHLESVMRMEAGRMNDVRIPAEEVLSERKVILEERRQRTDNGPRGQFGEQLTAAAFVNHPYGIPVIGWKHEMDELSFEDAMAFYDAWYAPNRSILVVSGDVKADDVFGLAKDIYGTLPREEEISRVRTRSPELNSKTTVTLEHPSIREPVVQTLFRVPSARQNKADALALQVLSEIMDGGATSRIYKSLVVEQKIASGAGLSYQGDAWDDGRLWIYATPNKGVELDVVQNALLVELKKLISDGVSDVELRDAINRMRDQAIYARDSLTGPAMIVGRGLASGSSLDDIEYWPFDIAGVTAAQVQDVAKRYLNVDVPRGQPPISGYLLPEVVVPVVIEGDETAEKTDSEVKEKGGLNE